MDRDTMRSYYLQTVAIHGQYGLLTFDLPLTPPSPSAAASCGHSHVVWRARWRPFCRHPYVGQPRSYVHGTPTTMQTRPSSAIRHCLPGTEKGTNKDTTLPLRGWRGARISSCGSCIRMARDVGACQDCVVSRGNVTGHPSCKAVRLGCISLLRQQSVRTMSKHDISCSIDTTRLLRQRSS